MRWTSFAIASLAVAGAQPARAGIPDGGPGGACLNDSDCGICGWVCSVARGNICVPAAEGDPGHCDTNPECPCPGQTCTASSCTPAPKPACWCNGDCPAGDVCDQLLFSCHPASPIYCGRAYDGYDYGPQTTGPACGCNGICGQSAGKLICEPQLSTLPPECSSDLDCGSCYQKLVCLEGVCTATSGAGWCTDSRDVSPPSLAPPEADAGDGTPTKSSGCSSGRASGAGLVLATGLLAARLLRRRKRGGLM